MTDPCFLGIDQSWTCTAVVAVNYQMEVAGSYEIKVPNKMRKQRHKFKFIYDSIREICRQHNVAVVTREDYTFSSDRTAKFSAGELASIIDLVFSQMGFDIRKNHFVIHANVWRKLVYAMGKTPYNMSEKKTHADQYIEWQNNKFLSVGYPESVVPYLTSTDLSDAYGLAMAGRIAYYCYNGEYVLHRLPDHVAEGMLDTKKMSRKKVKKREVLEMFPKDQVRFFKDF